MIDEQIAHQLALAQVIETISNYDYIVAEVREQVNETLATTEAIVTIAQMRVVQSAVSETLESIFNEAEKRNNKAIKDLTKAEVKAQLDILKANGYDIKRSDFDDVEQKGLNRPFKLGSGYQKSADMFAQAKAGLLKQSRAIVAGGYYGGESIQDIKSAINGTSTSGYKDGLAAKARNDFSTITRTQATAVETQAKQEAYKAVGSDGYVYNSIVDSRTSSVCRTLHGRKYLWKGVGRKPMPPMHYNCRSSIVPYFKGEKNELEGVNYYDWLRRQNANVQDELLGKKLGKVFRNAGLNQAEPNKLVGQNYYTWLKRQPAEVQDEVLGKKLGKVFRNAGLSNDEFRKVTTNRFGEPLTLEEMAQKDKRIRTYLQDPKN